MKAITVENLSKTFVVYARPRHRLIEILTLGSKNLHREVRALKDISFEVEKGECLGVIGANGAGKSTLLRLLAGISRPTSGGISIEGSVSALLELNSGFHPEFTGRENIRINASILGIPRESIDSKTEEIVSFSELGDFIDLPVRTYSSGMFLRLGFAVATAVDPEVFLVDESLAVGDEYFRGKCWQRMREFRSSGKTIVIVSHDLTMIRGLCTSAVVLENGALSFSGTPPDAIEAYLDKIYMAAAEEAKDGGVMSKGFIRRGTGDLEIKDVRMLNSEGAISNVFRTGEPLSIEFDYSAKKDIGDPLFGVNVFRADGVLIISTNNECGRFANSVFEPHAELGDKPEGILAGKSGTARFHIEKNYLKEGTYELSVNVFQGKSGSHSLVEELLGVVKFNVLPGKFLERGVYVQPGKWKID